MVLGSLLLLLSAFFHASWNALTKKSVDKEALLLGMTVLSAGLTLALILISRPDLHMLSLPTWMFTLLSGVFEGVYLVALSRALTTTSLGKAYAIMRGGAMILVWCVSLIFLEEVTKLSHAFGAVIVFIGIINLSYTSTKKKSQLTFSIWPFLSALCIAGYHICYHQALESHADPQVLFLISMCISFLILVLSFKGTATKRIRTIFKSEFKTVVLTAIFSTASFLIFLYALRISAPGFAISLRNSSIFFALLFSYVLKESLSRIQILGAMIIGVGTILLSLP